MDYPREYRYSPQRCWVHVVGESARVGVCPGLLGDGSVSNVSLPVLGVALSGNEPVATLTIDGKSIGIHSPVAGSVVLVNERLLQEPALVGSDPFGAGWLFEVQLSYDETLENVMDVDSYLRIGN